MRFSQIFGFFWLPYDLNYRNPRILLLILISSASSLFGVILSAPDLVIVEQELNKSNSKSLVLFDVDYTLLIPKDAILRPCGRALKTKLVKEILDNPAVVPIGKYTDGFLRSKAILQAHSELVDPKVLSLITSLRQRGVPTIALTLVEAGRLGVIPNMAEWRLNEMKELGLVFDWSFSEVGYLEFVKDTGRSTAPAFKGGVLFSARHAKGPILQAFLDKIRWRPDKVIFIDDNRAFLQSVETVVAELGIPFVGIHYTGAESVPCIVDEKLAEFQFWYLATYGDWLSDEDAHQRMKLQNSRT